MRQNWRNKPNNRSHEKKRIEELEELCQPDKMVLDVTVTDDTWMNLNLAEFAKQTLELE